MQGAWVLSLLGELKSLMPLDQKKKEERSRDRVWRLNDFVPCPHPRGAEKAYVTGIRCKLFYFLVCTVRMTAVTFSQGRVRNAMRSDK